MVTIREMDKSHALQGNIRIVIFHIKGAGNLSVRMASRRPKTLFTELILIMNHVDNES